MSLYLSTQQTALLRNIRVLLAIAVLVFGVWGLMGGASQVVFAQQAGEMLLGDDGQLTPYDIQTQPYEMVTEDSAKTVADDVLAPETSSADEKSTPQPSGEVTDDTSLNTVFEGKPPLISSDMLMRIGLSFLVVMLLLMAFFKWGLPMVLKSPAVRQRLGNNPRQPIPPHFSATAEPNTYESASAYEAEVALERSASRWSQPQAPEAFPASEQPNHSSQGWHSPQHVAQNSSIPQSQGPVSPWNVAENTIGSSQDWSAAVNNMALPMTVIKRFQLNRHDAVEFVTIWDRYFLVAYSRLGSLLLAEFIASSPNGSGVVQWQCVPSHMPVRHPAAQWLAQYPQLAEECVAFLSQPPSALTQPSGSFAAISAPALPLQSVASGWGELSAADNRAPQAISPGRAAMAADSQSSMPAAAAPEDAPSRLGQLLRKYLPSDKWPSESAAATTHAESNISASSQYRPSSEPVSVQGHATLPLPDQFAVFQQQAPPTHEKPFQEQRTDGSESFRPDIYSQVPPQEPVTSAEHGERAASSAVMPAEGPVATTLVDYGPAPNERPPAPEPPPSKPAPTPLPPLSERKAPSAADLTTQRENVAAANATGVDVRATSSGAQAVDRLKSMRGDDVPIRVGGNRPFTPSTEGRTPMRVHPIDEDIEIFDDYDDTF